METRASHIVVGSFVLVFIGAMVAFSIWIAKVDPDARYVNYDILFEGTVSGLYKGGTVYYLGVPVGSVRNISLAPSDPRNVNDPRKVRVHVRLREEVPVTAGALARLEFQGLTGVAYVELSGGTAIGQNIQAKEGEERPVIPSENSAFQEIFESAPNLVNEAILAVVRIQKLLKDDNLDRIAAILKHTEDATSNIARGTKDVDGLITDARTTFAGVNDTMKSLTAVADKTGALIEKDVAELLAGAHQTVNNLNTMIKRLDNIVAAADEPVSQFVGTSLPEISRMIMDLRVTARSLSRLVQNIEEDPSSVLFPSKPATYNAKTGNKTKQKEK